jgi:hypothetical protein
MHRQLASFVHELRRHPDAVMRERAAEEEQGPPA